MIRLLCFGDSNTYGYDPRGAWGGRYPAAGRWPEQLAALSGWAVLNGGENGREISHRPQSLRQLDALLQASQPLDLCILMLGTNDLLNSYFPTADAIAGRMEALFCHLRGGWPSLPLVLAAPPSVVLPDPDLVQVSHELGGAYAALAAKLDLPFADAGQWGLSLAFDGVHLTEQAHRQFAGQMFRFLSSLPQFCNQEDSHHA